MRLASLDLWPEKPHMDNVTHASYLVGPINPAARFVRGFMHDDAHLGQITEIIRQAEAARS
jgi:hypothetical protein